jgi:hypothetical protein
LAGEKGWPATIIVQARAAVGLAGGVLLVALVVHAD